MASEHLAVRVGLHPNLWSAAQSLIRTEDNLNAPFGNLSELVERAIPDLVRSLPVNGQERRATGVEVS